MPQVDARLNRRELKALLAALDCFTSGPQACGNPLWWKKVAIERATLEALKQRFETELALLA